LHEERDQAVVLVASLQEDKSALEMKVSEYTRSGDQLAKQNTVFEKLIEEQVTEIQKLTSDKEHMRIALADSLKERQELVKEKAELDRVVEAYGDVVPAIFDTAERHGD
jgi:chromosome segregation ATPase